ncbi:MAG: hypothetical protein U0573_07640 [Phycisphaerales bacterium]|nr:hypothetical protein [Planctomycetota bacterium]
MTPSGIGIGILGIVGVILAVAIAVLLISYLIIPFFRVIAWIISRVVQFIFGELRDLVRTVGALLATLLFAPLVVINILLGRWSASAHFGNSVKAELAIAGACLYRIVLGHPARLFGASGLVEGIEQRFPEAVAHAPTADAPKGKGGRQGQFEGYRIVGSLPTGGSGSKLYIAEPDPIKRAALERSGFRDVDQVVIKSFAVDDGSNLPNIVRESRALEAAKKLGLVLDHELSPAKFYYVMRYVPGQTLNTVIQHMHAQSDPSLQGMDDRNLRNALGYVADLVSTLDQYHQGGLWHKDVKPENIIVEQLHGAPRAHLVDFGLVTPLRSAMTLTTHGTEYFRDPELVRLALRGVKVHEVDGAKFDVYAAGAVLFATMENSFPAHGVLSQVTRRCPEAIKWIIRRAMADYDKRYTSAAQMLADLNAVRSAADPFSMKPIDLPSMRIAGGGAEIPPPIPQAEPAFAGAHAGAAPESVRVAAAYASPVGPSPAAPARPGRPDIRLLNWWTGEHVVVPEAPSPNPTPQSPFENFARAAGAKVEFAVDRAFAAAERASGSPKVRHARRSAREQVEIARARIHAKREKMRSFRSVASAGRYTNKPGGGSAAGTAIFIGSIAFLFLILRGNGIFNWSSGSSAPAAQSALPAIQRDGAMETIRLASVGSADTEKAAKPSRTTRSKRVKAETPVLATSPLPAIVPQGTTALFVSDLPTPLNDESSKALNAVIDALKETGLDLKGDTPDTKADDEETVERLAKARVAVSGLEVASPEFRDRLSEWAGEEHADMVIWLRPQNDASGKPDPTKLPIAYVIASPNAGESARDAVRDAIAAALKVGK